MILIDLKQIDFSDIQKLIYFFNLMYKSASDYLKTFFITIIDSVKNKEKY